MAKYTIQVNERNFYVSEISRIETECSTTFTYEVLATNSDNITFTLNGDHIEENYTVNKVSTSFTDTDIVSFNQDLLITFSLENSGAVGNFDSTTLTVDNNNSALTFTFDLTRENDESKCASTSSTPPTMNYRLTSVDTTLLENDDTIDIDTSAVTITLPTSVGIVGKTYTIKNSSTGNIFLDADGSETIDGVLIATIIPDQSLTVQSNGTNWIII